MAWTTEEEARVRALEETVNDLQTAMNALATKAQLKQYTHIRQTEVDDLKARVASLEAQIAVLQAG